MPSGGETPRGIYPTRGSGNTSRTQAGATLAPMPHRTLPSFSYLLPTFPRSSPAVPILPTHYGGFIPHPANHIQWTTTFVPSTGTKRPPSAVLHTPRRPAPYYHPSPQLATYFASYLSRAATYIKSGVPDLGPPVEQTCHTGVIGGGVDSPPPG